MEIRPRVLYKAKEPTSDDDDTSDAFLKPLTLVPTSIVPDPDYGEDEHYSDDAEPDDEVEANEGINTLVSQKPDTGNASKKINPVSYKIKGRKERVAKEQDDTIRQFEESKAACKKKEILKYKIDKMKKLANDAKALKEKETADKKSRADKLAALRDTARRQARAPLPDELQQRLQEARVRKGVGAGSSTEPRTSAAPHQPVEIEMPECIPHVVAKFKDPLQWALGGDELLLKDDPSENVENVEPNRHGVFDLSDVSSHAAPPSGYHPFTEEALTVRSGKDVHERIGRGTAPYDAYAVAELSRSNCYPVQASTGKIHVSQPNGANATERGGKALNRLNATSVIRDKTQSKIVVPHLKPGYAYGNTGVLRSGTQSGSSNSSRNSSLTAVRDTKPTDARTSGNRRREGRVRAVSAPPGRSRVGSTRSSASTQPSSNFNRPTNRNSISSSKAGAQANSGAAIKKRSTSVPKRLKPTVHSSARDDEDDMAIYLNNRGDSTPDKRTLSVDEIMRRRQSGLDNTYDDSFSRKSFPLAVSNDDIADLPRLTDRTLDRQKKTLEEVSQMTAKNFEAAKTVMGQVERWQEMIKDFNLELEAKLAVRDSVDQDEIAGLKASLADKINGFVRDSQQWPDLRISEDGVASSEQSGASMGRESGFTAQLEHIQQEYWPQRLTQRLARKASCESDESDGHGKSEEMSPDGFYSPAKSTGGGVQIYDEPTFEYGEGESDSVDADREFTESSSSWRNNINIAVPSRPSSLSSRRGDKSDLLREFSSAGAALLSTVEQPTLDAMGDFHLDVRSDQDDPVFLEEADGVNNDEEDEVEFDDRADDQEQAQIGEYDDDSEYYEYEANFEGGDGDRSGLTSDPYLRQRLGMMADKDAILKKYGSVTSDQKGRRKKSIGRQSAAASVSKNAWIPSGVVSPLRRTSKAKKIAVAAHVPVSTSATVSSRPKERGGSSRANLRVGSRSSKTDKDRQMDNRSARSSVNSMSDKSARLPGSNGSGVPAATLRHAQIESGRLDDYPYSLRNLGELSTLLSTVDYRANYVGEGEGDDSSSSGSSDCGVEDHRIVSIYAKEMLTQREEQLEREQSARMAKNLADATRQIIARTSPKTKDENYESQYGENPSEATDPRTFWDSLLSRPINDAEEPLSPLQKNSVATSSSILQGIVDPAELNEVQEALDAAEAIEYSLGRESQNRQLESKQPIPPISGISDIPDRKKPHILYTPEEMRARMLTELRRQEDIFNYALELSELEQAYTMHSASEFTKQVMTQAEMAVVERQQQQELLLQQQAYEMSIASAMASANAALEKESQESNRTIDELKAQLHEQGLYTEYMQYFLQAAQVSENLQNAAEMLVIERKLQEKGKIDIFSSYFSV